MASKAQVEAELAALKKTSEAQAKELEEIKAKVEADKAAAKKRVEEQAIAKVKSTQSRLDAEPHHWVKVFNQGLADGVDFGFQYEGVGFKLYSGTPVELPESVIKHLKGCSFPIIVEKQGEAGQGPIRVHGRHHNFHVESCEAPDKEVKTEVA